MLSELVAQVEIPGLTADAATLLLAGMSSGWLLQVTPQVLPQSLPAVFCVVCVSGGCSIIAVPVVHVLEVFRMVETSVDAGKIERQGASSAGKHDAGLPPLKPADPFGGQLTFV